MLLRLYRALDRFFPLDLVVARERGRLTLDKGTVEILRVLLHEILVKNTLFHEPPLLAGGRADLPVNLRVVVVLENI